MRGSDQLSRVAEPQPFEIRREDIDAIAVIAVLGEVDVATAGELRSQLNAIPDTDCLVLDLCETSFMDSSGLAVLLAERDRRGARLHVVCTPAGPVARLFAAAQVTTAMQVHDSREKALTAAAIGAA
jgi:anti-anti-sigma factor